MRPVARNSKNKELNAVYNFGNFLPPRFIEVYDEGFRTRGSLLTIFIFCVFVIAVVEGEAGLAQHHEVGLTEVDLTRAEALRFPEEIGVLGADRLHERQLSSID